jgi:hypothetical protein
VEPYLHSSICLHVVKLYIGTTLPFTFALSPRPDRLRVHPATFPTGVGGPIKWQERERDLPASRIEVFIRWKFTSMPPICHHDAVLRRMAGAVSFLAKSK